MANIVVAPYGSLGDLHPHLALAIELDKRGHDVLVCSIEVYREKVETLGLRFMPLRPYIDENDRELAKEIMDPKSGSERIINGIMLPNLHDTYADLTSACEAIDADVLIPGEIVFPSHSVAEKLGIKLISTTLAPLSMFSTYEPSVFPNAQFLRHFNFLGRPAREAVAFLMRKMINHWLAPYRDFRREIGLPEDHNPILDGKYSKHLHLAMFSRVLGRSQPDWAAKTLQTGFCFYDGIDDLGVTPAGLNEFLDAGEPPIVFTLGSAAVMDPGTFFEESIDAAKQLNRRAIMIYGVFNEVPEGLDEDRIGFDYAPFGELFHRAACVVHQGGVGTTGQALRAGVPHLIMPYSHDQPDNAARCVRLGVARTIDRSAYSAFAAASELRKLLGDLRYNAKAKDAKRIVDNEDGTRTACDAIEQILN